MRTNIFFFSTCNLQTIFDNSNVNNILELVFNLLISVTVENQTSDNSLQLSIMIPVSNIKSVANRLLFCSVKKGGDSWITLLYY